MLILLAVKKNVVIFLVTPSLHKMASPFYSHIHCTQCLSVIIPPEAQKHADQRRLAAAAGAGDEQVLAQLHRERDVGQQDAGGIRYAKGHVFKDNLVSVSMELSNTEGAKVLNRANHSSNKVKGYLLFIIPTASAGAMLCGGCLTQMQSWRPAQVWGI